MPTPHWRKSTALIAPQPPLRSAASSPQKPLFPANPLAKPPVSPPTPAPQATSNFGAWLAGLYIFLFYSRILDVNAKLGALHIPMLLLIILMLMSLASGGLHKLISTRTAVLIGFLTLWGCICLPFSSWPGGSVETVKLSLQSFAVFCSILLLVRSIEGWMKVAKGMALAVVTAAILTFYFGKAINGRVAFEEGSHGDPNQFALVLLMGLPMWWLMARRAGGFSVTGMFSVVSTGIVLLAFFRAGSRAGLLALATMFLALLLQGSAIQRLRLIALAGVIAMGAVVFLPNYLLHRFFTVFSGSADAVENLTQEELQYMGADLGSSHSRRQLILDGLLLTVQHPIFGVGPGQFAQTNWEEWKGKGVRRGYTVNHNTFVQYSSETGVPGLVLYTLVLGSCFLDLRKIHRQAKARSHTQLMAAAQYLIASISAFSVGSFFLSLAFSPVIYALFGFVISFTTIAQAMMPPQQVAQGQALVKA